MVISAAPGTLELTSGTVNVYLAHGYSKGEGARGHGGSIPKMKH